MTSQGWTMQYGSKPINDMSRMGYLVLGSCLRVMARGVSLTNLLSWTRSTIQRIGINVVNEAHDQEEEYIYIAAMVMGWYEGTL
jgi:hypothetical protein